MRIALIGHQLPPRQTGGIGSLHADMVAELRARDEGDEAWVLVPDEDLGAAGEPAVRTESATWLPLSAPKAMGWRLGQYWRRAQILRELWREHRRKPFDVIEVTDCLGWLPWGGLPGVPLVVRLHGATFFFDAELGRETGSALDHDLERRTCARATRLVGVSRYALERTLHHGGPLLERFRADSSRCEVVLNAVDTVRFCPATDASSMVEPGLIVFANTIEYRKGIFELCRAFNEVASRFPNARLVCIGKQTGKSRDGKRPILDELRELVAPEHRARLEFTGPLDRWEGVLPWLRRAAVCVFPSHLETFGLAPVEAMAVGRPVIYSRLGPGPELMQHGEHGLLCDPHDPGDIAASITQLLAEPAAAEAMGARARAWATQEFSKAAWIERNLALYRSLKK